MFSRLFVGLLFCSIPGLAWGWGEEGHRVVGELAARQLTASARAAVADLLRDEPIPSLAGVAFWADEVRDQEAYAHTRPWHYVNLPDLRCEYVEARDCPGGRCVIGAIRKFTAMLGDTGYTRQQRAEALKYLVHFVGDVHQPLHVGLATDLGGNAVLLAYEGQDWNLHSVWDGLILRSTGRSWQAHADLLAERGPPAGDPASASEQSPREWAIESCRAITTQGIYPDAGQSTLYRSYLDAHLPFVEERLGRASARLAELLNRELGS